MSLSLLDRLLQLSQTIALFYPKPIVENYFDFFHAQPSRFWETKDHENPSQETQTGIEPECPGGSDGCHERQIR